MPLNGPPQLNYMSVDQNSDRKRWVLFLSQEDNKHFEDRSYGCEITYAFDGEGWSNYRFFYLDMGDFTEVVTNVQYEARLQAIRDHEGDEAANKWALEQTDVDIERDTHPVFELQRHWEALMQLKLFVPSVTLF